jgi:TRAP transporter TAXI family solute receptor
MGEKQGRRLAMRLILIALGTILALIKPGNAAETPITILTAMPSGIWYPLGATLSSIYGKALPGGNITVQATAGTAENLRLLEAGDGELAFALGDTLADAWAGNKQAGFDGPLRQLRAVARLFPAFFYIVASDRSGINTFADLKAKHVSLGPAGSGTALEAAAIFKAAGFTTSDLKDFVHAPFTPSLRMVGEGALDATVNSAGLGSDIVGHALASGHTRLIPIPTEVVGNLGSVVYTAGTVPAGTYEGQSADIPTVSVMTFLVTRERVSDDAVYLMTKSLFDHLDQLVQTHPAAKDIDVKKAAAGLPVPLHAGAERYYREIGILN